MMKIFVSGAGGFIGANVVKALLRRGYRVRASDHARVDLSWATQLGAEVVAADLLDEKQIARSLKGIDAVVHTAAIFDLTTPAKTLLHVNTQGTHNYCRAAVKAGAARFIQFSTVGVYGVPQRINLDETGRKRPRNAYELSKWQSEQIAFSYAGQRGLHVVALRPTLVYGPGSRYGQAMYAALFTCLSAWSLKALALPAGGRLTHHVHVADVVDAVLTLLKADSSAYGRAYNVADQRPLLSQQVVELFCREMGMQLRPLPGILNEALAPLFRWGQPLLAKRLRLLNQAMQKTWARFVARGWIKPVLTPKFDQGWLDYLWADHSFNTTALQQLGWQAKVPSFLQGMPKTIEWYRRQRWLPTVEQIKTFAMERKKTT